MFTDSGAARLAYDVAGPDRPVHDLLLLHAGVTDRRSWQPLVDSLADRHRCVRYDARGYGETTYEPEVGWSPVEDAVAVLDAAGVDSAVVVAGSMGGAVALDLALAHPDRVRALVLIGSAVRGAPYPEVADPATADLVARAEAAEEAEDWDEVNRLEARIWLDGPTADDGRVDGAVRDLFLEMNGQALRATDPGDRAPADDTWPRLGDIRVPVLVMVGRLDLEDIQAVAAALAEALVDARLVWLDGVAHLPQHEGDPTTLREIAGFVDGLPVG
ncbi:alpha/beta hydrolase [Nocardioides sp.]|uniref:alpha/beta fold hydrolase n=1 Tax=Nocardioides sp. TaxID=35761 RepID=UPI002D7FEECB|nr:alpha/beta hydrolase [Nocardioides sp.]HET8961579.1 alpha/beta hydrolase [Nocardioides sp.]